MIRGWHLEYEIQDKQVAKLTLMPHQQDVKLTLMPHKQVAKLKLMPPSMVVFETPDDRDKRIIATINELPNQQTRYFIANSDRYTDWTHKDSQRNTCADAAPLKYFIKDAGQSIQVVRLGDDLKTLKAYCRQALRHLQAPLSEAVLALLSIDEEIPADRSAHTVGASR